MFCVMWRTNSSLSSIWKALLNLRSKPIVDIGLPLKDRPQTEPESGSWQNFQIVRQ